MRDLHTRLLARKHTRPRALRVRRQVDEHVEIVFRDAVGGVRIGTCGNRREPVEDRLVALCPFVFGIDRRIAENLEGVAVVMAQRVPHHLAHHVVTEIAGKVADPRLPRLPPGTRRPWLAMNPARQRVVRARVTADQRRLHVEEVQQVEQLLQRILDLVRRTVGEAARAQAVEVALEPREIGSVGAHLERVRRERQMIRAMALEAFEVREPRVDPARGQQRFGQRLVGARVRRRAFQHVRKSRDGGTGVALLIEDDAEVEIGVMEVRLERERSLVRACRIIHFPRHLQCDAVVVVRLAVRRIAERRFGERLRGGLPVRARERRLPERAP